MRAPSATALRVELRASCALRRFVLAVHALGLVAAGLAPLDWAGRAVIAACVLASLVMHLRRLQCPVVRGLAWDASGGWRLLLAHGEEESVRLLVTTVRTAHGSLAHFRSARGTFFAVPVMSDAVTPEDFHRLCVRLRVPEDAGGNST